MAPPLSEQLRRPHLAPWVDDAEEASADSSEDTALSLIDDGADDVWRYRRDEATPE